MPPAFPITIRRSIFGLIGILLIGALVEGVLFFVVQSLTPHNPDPAFLYMLGFVVVFVLLATIVSAFVYQSGKIVLTDEGITVTNYKTLFFGTQAVTQWNLVEDITVQKSGLFNFLSGTGTIAVQSAGALPNFSLSVIDRPYYWQSLMLQQVAENNPNE